MKPNRASVVHTGLVCATLLVAASIVAYAGPLNPPAGPVSSTYRTLYEIEPRTPIGPTTTPGDADSVFRIAAPGSYYLPGNLGAQVGKCTIEIATWSVTLDLNGFQIGGLPGALDGIWVDPAVGLVTIRNGGVVNFPMDGVDARGSLGCAFENLRAVGCGGDGLLCGFSGRVTNCIGEGNGGAGIHSGDNSTIHGCSAHNNVYGISCYGSSSITQCAANGNSGIGISDSGGSVISLCSAAHNGQNGIASTVGATITQCSVILNTGSGIAAGSNALVRDNACDRNGLGVAGAGIVVGSDCRVEGNTCFGNSQGIRVNGDRNRIDSNSASGNSTSFLVSGVGNIIVRNSATGGVPNYSIAAGNSVAPLVGVTGSNGWAGITNANHPWANFGH